MSLRKAFYLSLYPKILKETRDILDFARQENYTMPGANDILQINDMIRGYKTLGLWDKIPAILNFSHGNTALADFSLIDWKRPYSNLVPYSDDWTNAAWVGNIKTPNTTDTAAPDGTFTACKFENLNATNTLQNATIVANSTTLTYSIYTKAGTAGIQRQFLLRNQTTATNFASGSLNYTTGAITTGTGGSGSWTATPVGNGWYRLTYTQNTGIAKGDQLIIYYGRTGIGNNDGSIHYVWGAQLEPGTVARTYRGNINSPAGVAFTMGGMTYTASGWESNGTDGYIQMTFNPVGDTNYKLNDASLTGVVYKSVGGYIAGHGTATVNRTTFANANSVNQKLQNAASLAANLDLSLTGYKYLSRTGGGTSISGEYTNKAIDGTFNYTLTGGTIDNAYFLLFRAPIAGFTAVGLSLFHPGSGQITPAMRQAERAIYNTWLQRKGLTQYA